MRKLGLFGRTGWLCLLCALGVSFACAQAQNSPSVKPASEEKPADPLLRMVRHQLLTLPFYSVFDNLSYSVNGRKVTLSGQVIRPTLKEQAEASVKTLEGVTQVVNNIEVLPASATDDELRRNIYRAIFENDMLKKYAIAAVPLIHIIVKNSSVTLEGLVDADADKALAAHQASTVANVSAVRNQLAVRARESPNN